MTRRSLRATLLLICAFSLCVEAQYSGIGYPSVAAALQALKGRRDVTISTRDGWTIVEDRGNTVWSFTPATYPAYPAVVKRTMTSKDGIPYVDMKVLCEAAKDPCNRLVEDFRRVNEQAAQTARERSVPAR